MFSYGAEDERRAECSACGRPQRVDTLFEKRIDWKAEVGVDQGTNAYFAFQCRVRAHIFFSRLLQSNVIIGSHFDPETDAEVPEYDWSLDVWPRTPRGTAKRLTLNPFASEKNRVFKLLQNTYDAIDHNLPVLAAIGARTTIDCLMEKLGITKGSFSEKLEELRKEGHISGTEKGDLECLIDAGSAAAHRGWEPSDEDLGTINMVLNRLVERVLLTGQQIRTLRKQVPPKKDT